MFKILTIGVLLYLLYRVVAPPPRIQSPSSQKEDDGEYIDYEEVD